MSLRLVAQSTALLCRRHSLWSRPYSTADFPADFHLLPDFFDIDEQNVLLAAALQKLDSMEPRAMRRRRKDYLALGRHADSKFLPDELYQFEEGHFDGVIKRYREMHVSSWDEAESPTLSAALERLRSMFPTKHDTQTHLLHLASDGEILPHVDNVGASGSWILGVSLGAARVLRLEFMAEDTPAKPFEILLPSGSVYIQRDDVRYRYKHSILPASPPLMQGSQRLSIMVRDRTPPNFDTLSL
ncbi:hypothetical protein FA95DRAFT_1580977 [Auriscalpium vulgare]|uniref:Uncharacterized protein n=1 Tax=Auriscalpium vulgare TaxID=40419 RepID=A0ACB8S515_9AGAM|nr:hypothetical protein FA95DRAFT_1580977 [Auriscalpium vulgare]